MKGGTSQGKTFVEGSKDGMGRFMGMERPDFYMPDEITLAEYQELTKPKNKYFARRVEVDGIWFDSKKEAERYRQLKILERCGEIRNLKLQPEFPLIVNGKLIGKYIADMSYFDLRKGLPVIEDVKSKATRTPLYLFKKKLFSALYGKEITEVY